MGRDNTLRIPDQLRHDVEEILKLTDPFCLQHLDAEYGELVRKLIAKLARKRPSPLARGALRIWAAAPFASGLRRPSHLGCGGNLRCGECELPLRPDAAPPSDR